MREREERQEKTCPRCGDVIEQTITCIREEALDASNVRTTRTTQIVRMSCQCPPWNWRLAVSYESAPAPWGRLAWLLAAGIALVAIGSVFHWW